MSHLSKLVLDEAAAKLPLDAEAAAHLASCAECGAKVSALQAENAKLLASPRASAVRNTLVGRHASSPPSDSRVQRRRVVGAAFAAIAAGILVTVFLPRPPADDQNRLKGSAAIEIVSASDGATITQAKVGQRVRLRVLKQGLPNAAVFVVDDLGEGEVVWPTAEKTSTSAPIDLELEVTPGSVWVYAVFTEKPVSLSTLSEHLAEVWNDQRLAHLKDEVWVRTRLEVVP